MHCHIVCAVNLQMLKDLMEKVWDFPISLDGGNNTGTAYLNVHVRCYHKHTLKNFHLLAITMLDKHTGEYQFDLLVMAQTYYNRLGSTS
jgi:hypothetical protein